MKWWHITIFSFCSLPKKNDVIATPCPYHIWIPTQLFNLIGKCLRVQPDREQEIHRMQNLYTCISKLMLYGGQTESLMKCAFSNKDSIMILMLVDSRVIFKWSLKLVAIHFFMWFKIRLRDIIIKSLKSCILYDHLVIS